MVSDLFSNMQEPSKEQEIALSESSDACSSLFRRKKPRGSVKVGILIGSSTSRKLSAVISDENWW